MPTFRQHNLAWQKEVVKNLKGNQSHRSFSYASRCKRNYVLMLENRLSKATLYCIIWLYCESWLVTNRLRWKVKKFSWKHPVSWTNAFKPFNGPPHRSSFPNCNHIIFSFLSVSNRNHHLLTAEGTYFSMRTNLCDFASVCFRLCLVRIWFCHSWLIRSSDQALTICCNSYCLTIPTSIWRDNMQP